MSRGSTVVLSGPPAARRWAGAWIVPLAAVLALGAGWLIWRTGAGNGGSSPAGQLYTVAPMDLDIRVVKDGELQAEQYTDIYCRVEGASQIIWLVKEGVGVKKGDDLVLLDSTVFQQRLDELQLDLQKAESDLTISREMKEIQESQNAANREAAEVALELAQLDLKQYEEGSYPQQVQNARTAVEMAQINLRNAEEDLFQTRSLFAKGFVTGADVKKSELAVTTARNELAKAQTAWKVLEQYTHQMDLTSKRNAVAQADQRLKRVIRENASLLAQKRADVAAKEQALNLLKQKADKLREQIANCTIRAPEDGLVIYASSIDRNMREQIQEGAQVREKQLLLRLPDVSRMKAVVKVTEAQVTRLDVAKNMRALVRIEGVREPIGATLTKVSVVPDSGSRWWSPDVKEYPVEVSLDYTPPGLKPTVGAKVEILVDRRPGVLAVPVDAVYSVGRDSYVFVFQDGQEKPVKVETDASNETHVQITRGLAGGEQVLRLAAGQGRILAERAGIKVEPATRPGMGADRRGRGRRSGGDGGGTSGGAGTPAGI